MDDHASFGYWVRRRRKALDLTQEELARQVGCSVMTIRKIEGDIRRPSRQIADLLANCLEIAAPERDAFVKAARAELRVDRLPQPAAGLTDHPRPPAGAAPDDDGAPVESGVAPSITRALPGGTVTFLFTDIEGSTRLWEQHPQAMPAALAQHNTLLQQAIDAHGGVVFKTVGDAFCAAFPTAPAALHAALAAQRALRDAAWGPTGPIRVRMALHTATVAPQAGDYPSGPYFNRLARLLATGHGGQVLLSRTSADLLRDTLPPDLGLQDLGEHPLKDLSRPEHVFQLVAPDLSSAFPPLRAPPSRTHNLPAELTPLIGRAQEVAAVRDLLECPEVRLLTLTGVGGTGKTRLALQVAADLRHAFADGVWFVNLVPISDPALVLPTIAQTLGVFESARRTLAETMQDYAREKELLLVLDNLEHLLSAGPDIAALLTAAPRLKVLVTSRVGLRLSGEHEVVVPPLGLPERAEGTDPAQVLEAAAVQLFVARARAAKAGFTLTHEHAAAVAAICRRLDGLPLAIELAAARIKLFPPAALLARLERRLTFLTGGARDLPARQQTLRNAIDWSYQLLSPDEQHLFAGLSVFVGGRTLEAITEVVTSDELQVPSTTTPDSLRVTRYALLDLLATLLDNHLVYQELGPDDEPRFMMLETLWEYAQERLNASAHAETLRRRHAQYYLALAEQAAEELSGPAQGLWLERLEAEHGNLRAALAWALEHGAGEVAVRLSAALWHFWEMRGHFSEGRRWLAAALERGQAAPAAARAAAYTGAGTMAWHHADYAQATLWHEQALELYREIGDTEGMAFALNNLGIQSLYQGDLESTAQFYRESLALAQQYGHTRLSAGVLYNLGEMARYQGDYARAVEYYTQSLTVCRALGDQWLSCYSLTGLGIVAGSQGNHAQAVEFLTEALMICRKQGYQEVLVECLEGLAGCAARQRQVERAARLFGAAERLREMLQAPRAPVEDLWYPEAVALARAALAPAAFEAAWKDGRAMPLEEAIAYVLKGDEHRTR